MQTSIHENIEMELRGLFHYSIIPIIVLTLILIIFMILFIFLMKKNKKKGGPVVVEPNSKDKNQIKLAYLKKLNELSLNVQKNSINNRMAYQTLSKLIRNFIYEMTSIRVQNYTLTDIKKINMPILYELVKEYYEPEFSKNTKGNIIHSIEKARKVIESWN